MSEKHVQKISPWFGLIETVLVFGRVADRFAEQREINSIHERNGRGVRVGKNTVGYFLHRVVSFSQFCRRAECELLQGKREEPRRDQPVN